MNIPPPGTLVEIWNGPTAWYEVNDAVWYAAKNLQNSSRGYNYNMYPLLALWSVTQSKVPHYDGPFTCVLLKHEMGNMGAYDHVLVLHPDHGIRVGRLVQNFAKIIEVKP